MTNKRKHYNPQFKAKVSIEAIRGEKTVSQLAVQYSLHPTVINNWKRQLLESATQVFETENSANRASSDTQSQIDELYRQIGQLKVERDFLANRSVKLGLPTEKLW
jgi:transposase